MDTPGRLLTLDDVTHIAQEDPDHRYELLDGNLLVAPPGTVRHQRIIARMIAWLLTHGDPTGSSSSRECGPRKTA